MELLSQTSGALTHFSKKSAGIVSASICHTKHGRLIGCQNPTLSVFDTETLDPTQCRSKFIVGAGLVGVELNACCACLFVRSVSDTFHFLSLSMQCQSCIRILRLTHNQT